MDVAKDKTQPVSALLAWSERTWPRHAQHLLVMLVVGALGLVAWRGYGLSAWSCRPTILHNPGPSAPTLVHQTIGLQPFAPLTPWPLPQAAPSGRGSTKEAALTDRIDLNRAGLAELQKLPGIGPKLAQRIVDERGKGPFRSVDELRRVAGFGVKTIARLRPFVVATVDQSATNEPDPTIQEPR